MPLANPDADRLRQTLLAAHLEGGLAGIDAADREALSRRVAALANPRMDWPVYENTAEVDVRLWWHQRTALHRKAHALSRELKDAERSLGEDPSEANFAWLRDVRERLSNLDGTEALVEGFGASSGRASARSV